MKASTRGTSGARLPLMLLLGFAVLTAGVVVWLTLSSPDPIVTAETPADKKSAVPEQKPAAKPENEPGSAPKDNASKPAPDTAEAAKPPAHGNDGDHQQPTAQGNAAPDPTPTKPPAQTVTARPQVTDGPPAKPPAKTPEKSIARKQPAPAAVRTVMPKKLPRVAPDRPCLHR